jgi:hypothetical protein
MRSYPDTCILQIDETGTLGRINYYSKRDWEEAVKSGGLIEISKL